MFKKNLLEKPDVVEEQSISFDLSSVHIVFSDVLKICWDEVVWFGNQWITGLWWNFD